MTNATNTHFYKPYTVALNDDALVVLLF